MNALDAGMLHSEVRDLATRVLVATMAGGSRAALSAVLVRYRRPPTDGADHSAAERLALAETFGRLAHTRTAVTWDLFEPVVSALIDVAHAVPAPATTAAAAEVAPATPDVRRSALAALATVITSRPSSVSPANARILPALALTTLADPATLDDRRGSWHRECGTRRA